MPRTIRPFLTGFLSFCLLFGLHTAFLHSQELEWEEAPQFDVEIGGKNEPSTRAFQPAGSKPYIIILSDEFSKPVLIDLKAKTITELASKDVKNTGEFTISTRGIPKGRAVGKYAFKNGASVFSYNRASIAIRVRESLVGEVSEGVLLAHSPVYRVIRDAYKPGAKALGSIKQISKKTDIVVMFASWCPTCKRIIPKFLRIKDEAANRNLSIRYIGIAMGGSEPRPLLEQYGYDYPCLIFYQDGKEIGRVIGEPPVPLEEAIVATLRKK